MRLAKAAVFLVVVLLTGCGNVTSSPAPTSATSTTTPKAATRRLTQQELEATLLAIKDLPSGWSRETKTNSTTTSSTNKPGLCGAVPQSTTSKEKADRSFMRGGGLTVNYANVQIAQFESPEAAKSAWDPAVRPIADCTSWTDDQGTNWTVAEMSAPKLGDDSMGVRMQQKSGTAIVYLSRTGPAIVMVTGAGLTDVPTAELEMLLKAQVTSYQASLAKQQ